MDRLLKAARASGSLNLSNRSLKYDGHEFCTTLKDVDHTVAKIAFMLLSSDVSQEEDYLYKNRLKELAQKKGHILSVYATNRTGPPHMLSFASMVGVVEARTKTQAEMNAAKVAYNALTEGKCQMRYTKVWMRLVKVKTGGRRGKTFSIEDCLFRKSEKGRKRLPVSSRVFNLAAVELQKLILAHNNIELLKEDIRNLPLLSVLNISHNKLSRLPSAIGELKSLKALDVSSNLLHEIPEEIGSATSLIKFDCSSNQLKDLPCSLGNCIDLSDLKASNNCLTSLPEDLGNCSKISKLDVEGNKLTVLSEKLVASWTLLTEFNAAKNTLNGIPESTGSLSRIIRLDLHQNRIQSIPSSIKGCSSLAEFYMGNNFLTSLPRELGELTNLGTFDVHSNQLKDYPVEACKLRLSVLDLSNNSLSGLPPEIGLMTSLRRLVLTGNPIRTLRSSLVSGPTPALLRFLRSRLPAKEETSENKEKVVAMASRLSLASKELSLKGHGLSNVPPQVWKTSDITKVDLSKNSIEDLPIELKSFASLETLILSSNKIKVWPSAILESLQNLVCLKLDSNPLIQIPSDGFQVASRLQVLDLSCNAGCLPEYPAFSFLLNLQELYLRRMQISEVRTDILSLTKLRILDMSQNSIQVIPEGFKDATSLQELHLSDNNISMLPPELGLLESSLQVLQLDGNPLRSIRRAILDRGTKAILKYLKDKLPDQ